MLTLTSPHDCFAHRWPAGVKLALLCGFTVLLFALRSPVALGLCGAAVAALFVTAGTEFARSGLVLLRPLVPFVVVVAVWHLITGDAGGVAIILRMITAVAAANFVTMTTRLSDMIATLEGLARPFARFLPARSMALAIALTIRFVPVLLIRAGQIRESWRARSPRRPGWRSLAPITLSALDDADRVAEALRARGGV